MRKILIVVIMIFVAAVAGIMLIRDSHTETDITAETTRIGLILNGSHNDRNYVQTHFEALQSLQKELNLKIICREKVPKDCYKEIVDLIEKEDCKIIVANSFEFGEYMKKAALAYPNTYFLHATGTSHSINMSTYFGRMYQARYLAGIVAALESKTGELGYVASFPLPEVIRGINAFMLGAHSVRPETVVYVRFCNSWTADEPAETATKTLLDNHPQIDVIAVHTNSLKPHKVTESRGIMSIGCNKDNSDLFASAYLTAVEWNWQGYYREQILDCLRGKFHGTHKWIGMNDGIVKLSGFSSIVSEETKAAVAAANDRLTSREFDVFYGPIRDNTGKLRLDEGESMSDNAMLNTFNWYVEGVTIEQ